MSRLEISAPDRAQLVIEGLYKDLERRIESSPPGLCPVDMTRAFLEMCHTHTCGKCVPCRIGLWQLKNLLTDVMNGDATMDTLDLMEELAVSIMEGADCAIGYEAAHMVYKSLSVCREDYEEHVHQGRCTCHYSQPVPFGIFFQIGTFEFIFFFQLCISLLEILDVFPAELHAASDSHVLVVFHFIKPL